MKEIKIYINLSEEIEEELYSQGLSLGTFLKEAKVKAGKEEISIKGMPATRSIFWYILARVGEYILFKVLPKIAGKVLEEGGKQVLEKAVGKALKPLLDWLEGNRKKNEKIVININIIVQSKTEGDEDKLELRPLSDDVIEQVEKILIDIKKEVSGK